MSPSLSFFKNRDISRIAFFCFGNRDRTDDSFGLLVADELVKIYPTSVFSEEVEDISTFLIDIVDTERYDGIVIIDAVDYGAQPGTLLITSDISSYIKSISSHAIPLQEIFEFVSLKNKDFLLIGSQAKSVEFMKTPSEEILKAVDNVLDLLK
ncbi:MAG: hydrogenase maturation protease [Candidatus Heimdallarchaeota archaeon]|nr:hydrogenase maturation protease [Candidatus Heimdallarchaeota archaeon]